MTATPTTPPLDTVGQPGPDDEELIVPPFRSPGPEVTPEPERDDSAEDPAEQRRESLQSRFGLAIACFFSFMVFWVLNWPTVEFEMDGSWWEFWKYPSAVGDYLGASVLFADTTPSGGDMGAHVWGPAYLRDHLLSDFRLNGWTPDWYAGFPAFQFYMVVPALAIVALNAGLPWYLGIVPAVGVVGASVRWRERFGSWSRWAIAASIVVAVLLVSLPYGISFKLVSVSGLIMFPLAAWAMGHLARAPNPVPAFLSFAGFIFVFDTNFTIYGGNVASTLAGEFAFSVSLCLALVAIGLAIRGMDDQRWRGPAAVVIALVALCHILPVFFLIPAVVLAVLGDRQVPRSWLLAGIVAFALAPILVADGLTPLSVVLAIALVLAIVVLAMVAEPRIFQRAGWLLLAGPVSVLLAAFWLLPFILGHTYFNDMGWERVDEIGHLLLTTPIKIALPVAAIGVLVGFANRDRVAMVFSGTGLLFASAVANLPEGPLWNVRLLPFYYLSVYLLAAVGVATVLRMVASSLAGDMRRPDLRVVLAGTAVAAFAVLVAVGMPLRKVPFGQTQADGDYVWPAIDIGDNGFDGPFVNSAESLVTNWANWNYSGYEEKNSYREYHDVVSAMAEVGDDQGCGRAMWEYEKGLDRYGTPMALMLLPHWTDGCIGSMEGLYFESSATTPFHFLNQSTLSEAPSRAQRDLPYLPFDINIGVAQLQVMGVRYYMAQSDSAIAAAREHPDLTEVTEAPPFVVFEVSGSELVEGLATEPVVASGRTAEEVAGPEGDPEAITRFETGWVSQAVAFYNSPTSYDALPAETGPDEWERVRSIDGSQGRAIDPVEISELDVGNDSISFTVDRIGSPVLVKVSYFPNWDVSGADGPYRVGPNLMVVVPNEERVELTYGRSVTDLVAIFLTLVGLAGLFALAMIDRRRWRLPALDGLGQPTAVAPPAGGTGDWANRADFDELIDPDEDLGGPIGDPVANRISGSVIEPTGGSIDGRAGPAVAFGPPATGAGQAGATAFGPPATDAGQAGRTGRTVEAETSPVGGVSDGVGDHGGSSANGVGEGVGERAAGDALDQPDNDANPGRPGVTPSDSAAEPEPDGEPPPPA